MTWHDIKVTKIHHSINKPLHLVLTQLVHTLAINWQQLIADIQSREARVGRRILRDIIDDDRRSTIRRTANREPIPPVAVTAQFDHQIVVIELVNTAAPVKTGLLHGSIARYWWFRFVEIYAAGKPSEVRDSLFTRHGQVLWRGYKGVFKTVLSTVMYNQMVQSKECQKCKSWMPRHSLDDNRTRCRCLWATCSDDYRNTVSPQSQPHW